MENINTSAKDCFFGGCNASDTAIEKEGSDTRMRINFSAGSSSSKLNRLFTTRARRGLLGRI